MFIVIMKIHSRRAYQPISVARSSYHFFRLSRKLSNLKRNRRISLRHLRCELLKKNSIFKAFMLQRWQTKAARRRNIQFSVVDKKPASSYRRMERKPFSRVLVPWTWLRQRSGRERLNERNEASSIKATYFPLACDCYEAPNGHRAQQHVKQIPTSPASDDAGIYSSSSTPNSIKHFVCLLCCSAASALRTFWRRSLDVIINDNKIGDKRPRMAAG